MPLALVQSLDECFIAIKGVQTGLNKVAELKDLANRSTDPLYREMALRKADESALGFVKIYEDAVTNIHGLSFVPAVLAVILRVLDLLLGMVWQQRIIRYFQASLIGFIIVKRSRPNVPAIITGALGLLPFTGSGTLTKLVGGYFCFDSILSPLVLYLEKNISDRVEVRWILIGLLLDIVYLLATTVLCLTDSIIFVFLIAGILCILSFVPITLVYQHGWWDSYFKIKPGKAPGRYIQHPISCFVESSSRYIIQICIFRLNHVAAWMLELIPQVDRWEERKNSESSSASSYEYSELKSNHHIRLLKLQPRRPFEGIECHFVELPLEEAETYEAISYVWGDNSLCRSVNINGYSLTITQSAYDILRQYRSLWKDKLIWIDQICINQKNDQEKSSQVQMMKIIYENATRVVAFLGPATDSHLVQSHIAQLFYRYHGLGYSFKALKDLYQRESKREEWDALGRFFGNPYFRRVWILQEVVSANEMYIFYGKACLDWTTVSRALDVLGDREMLEAFLPSDYMFHSSARENTMIGLANVNSMLMFRGEVGGRKDNYSLARVLEICLGFNSKDPRDKVYAILGMASESSSKEIVPNYSKENLPHHVYTQTMRFLLTRKNNPLLSLNLAGIGHERLVRELPSWVPDWSLCVRPQPRDQPHSAASNYKAVIRLSPHDITVVYLEGGTIDTIAHMGEIQAKISTWTVKDANTYMQKWFSDAEALAFKYASDPYPIHGLEPQSVLEAFIRTMISNQSSYRNEIPTTDQCLEDYEALKEYYISSHTLLANLLMESPESWQESLLETMPPLGSERYKKICSRAARFLHFCGGSIKRRFCITKQGRMATVPPFCQVGDIVCLIKGAKMPYIMRKKTIADRSVYELVGNCYVHGVMNGEVLIQSPETFEIV